MDRNGLWLGRWWRTIDDRVILASESGVLDVPSAEIVAKGGFSPARYPDPHRKGRIVSDDGKEGLSKQEAYGEWLHNGLLDLKTWPSASASHPTTSPSCAARSPSATPKKIYRLHDREHRRLARVQRDLRATNGGPLDTTVQLRHESTCSCTPAGQIGLGL